VAIRRELQWRRLSNEPNQVPSKTLIMSRFRPPAALVLLFAAAADAWGQSVGPRTIELAPPTATLPAEFTLVSSVRELSDGRLLIADASERTLFVATWPKGSVAQIGRNGSGPGEYLQPSALFALRGDSTLLPDSRNSRWLLLSGAAIATTVGPDSPVIKGGARLPLGADEHGNVLVSRPMGEGAAAAATGLGVREPAQATPRLDSVRLVRIARATGRADTLAMLKARAATIKVQGPANNPTSVEILINPLATGELAALFPDGWIAIARLDPYRVDWIAPDGRTIRGLALPFERTRLDLDEQRAFVERQAARTGRPPRDLASFAEWPEIMPPFLTESLLRAPDGRLWIRRTPTAAQPNPPYDVVDRRGVLVDRVSSGKDVDIVGFGRGVVYTVLTDDDGIQHVQRRPFPGN
jgi:hypothetical protein